MARMPTGTKHRSERQHKYTRVPPGLSKEGRTTRLLRICVAAHAGFAIAPYKDRYYHSIGEIVSEATPWCKCVKNINDT